jgi:hypothetical protein
VKKVSSSLVGENYRRAVLTTQKVRAAINRSSAPWSESEQRIAVELIKYLSGGTPSRLLVHKIMHVVNDTVRPVELHGDVVYVSWIELDQYVGLRPEQQRLIERSFRESCEQTSTLINA